MAKKAKKAAKRGGKKSSKGSSAARRDWSNDELKQMKTLIRQNTPTRLIAMKLKRSEPSVRYKAQSEGLSLRPTNRSPRD